MRRAIAPGDPGAVVLAHDVQAGVDAGGGAGAGDDRAVLDVQHVAVDAGDREAPGEVVGVAPVRGGAAAVQQAGPPEQERARADRQDAGAAVDGVAQRLEHLVRHVAVAAARPGPRRGRPARAAPGPWLGTRSNPYGVRTGRPPGEQTSKAKAGSPSAERSTPKTSHTTPSSNGSTPSSTTTATSATMPRVWQELVDLWQSCHSWRDVEESTVPAMTLLLLLLVLLVAVVVALAREIDADGYGRRPAPRSVPPEPPWPL